MPKPFLINVLPDRLKTTAFYRLYNPLPKRWAHLLDSAPLRYAPGTEMVSLVKGDVISNSIAVTGFYELELTRKIVALARHGGRLVDAGANLGYFSLLWLALHPSNTCVSIEASPRNVPLLKQNVAHNKFEDRCKIVPYAVGHSVGKLQFDLGPEDQSGWGGLKLEAGNHTVEVDVVRIDEIISDDNPIDVLKVDVEGADTWVLQGCEKLLARRQIKSIFFEQHDARLRAIGIEPGAAVKQLKTFGYHVELLSDPNGGCVEYAAFAP